MYTRFIYNDDGIEVHEDSFDNPTLEKVANYIAEMLTQYDEIPDDLLKRLDGVETDKFSLFIDDDDDDVLLISSRYLGEAKVYLTDDGEIILEDKRYVYVEDELSGKEIEGVVYNTIKIIQDEFLNYLMQEKGDIIELLDKHERWHISFEDYEGPIWSATYNVSNESDISKDDAKTVIEAFVEYLLQYGEFFEDPYFRWSFDNEKNIIKITFEYYDDGATWKEYIEFTVV